MNKDIRLVIGFCDHPKTIKLVRRLGEDSIRYLLRLWLWAAQNRPDGNLKGMDAEDIEIAAGWTGENKQLFEALISIKFLDASSKGFALHNWEEHQGWVCHAEERSLRAKQAAEARWKARNKNKEDKEEKCGEHAGSNAESMHDACGEHTSSNAPSPNPLPSPNPNPKTLKPIRDEKPPRHTFNANLFFEEFWTAYPYRNQKKLNKKQALDQYRKHVKDEAQAKQILEAVKKYAIHTDAVKDAFRWIRDENYKEWITPDIREVDDGAGRQLIARYNNSELQMLKNDRDLRQELGISEEELDSAFRLIADNADQPGRMES